MSAVTSAAGATTVADIRSPEDVKPPWTVLAYVPVSLIWMILAELTDDDPFLPWSVVLGLILTLAIAYGMYCRNRGGWMVGVFVMVFPIMGVPIFLRESTTAGVVQVAGVLSLLFLLFHPETLRWCSPWRRGDSRERSRGLPNT